MDMIGSIRCAHSRKNKSQRQIARITGLSRNTVASRCPDPEHAARGVVRRLAHDLLDQALEGRDAGGRFAAAEHLGTMNVQRRKVRPMARHARADPPPAGHGPGPARLGPSAVRRQRARRAPRLAGRAFPRPPAMPAVSVHRRRRRGPEPAARGRGGGQGASARAICCSTCGSGSGRRTLAWPVSGSCSMAKGP